MSATLFNCPAIGLIEDVSALAESSGLQIITAEGQRKTDAELCAELQDNLDSILWTIEKDDGRPYQNVDGNTWIRMKWKHIYGPENGWDRMPAIDRLIIRRTIGKPKQMQVKQVYSNTGEPVVDELGNTIDETVEVIEVEWSGHPDETFHETVENIRQRYDGATYIKNGQPQSTEIDVRIPAKTNTSQKSSRKRKQRSEDIQQSVLQQAGLSAPVPRSSRSPIVIDSEDDEKYADTAIEAAYILPVARQLPSEGVEMSSSKEPFSPTPTVAQPESASVSASCVKIDSKVDFFSLPEQTRFRLGVYDLIRTNKLKMQQCDYTNNFENLRLLQKDKLGLSSSFVMTGTVKVPATVSDGSGSRLKTDILLKLAFEQVFRVKRMRQYDNSLEVERNIYKRIVNPLMTRGHTPHVVAYYGELVCDTFWQTLQRLASENSTAEQILAYLKRNGRKLESNGYDVRKMRALITERSRGIDLRYFIVRTNGRLIQSNAAQQSQFETIYLPVLFQLFYTLLVFQQVGLQHNDLHAGNIFVDKLDAASRSVYKVDSKQCYLHNSAFMVRIFDFDRAAKLPTQYDSCKLQNKALDNFYCKRYGQCAQLNVRFEIYRLICNIYRVNGASKASQNSFLRQFCTFVVPEKVLKLQSGKKKGDLAAGCILCFCDREGCDSCSIRDNPSIKQPKDVLQSHYFKQFRVFCPSNAEFLWQTPAAANTNS